LAQLPSHPADDLPEEVNLVLWDGDLVDNDLFLLDAPSPAPPLPPTGWVDRETAKFGEQLPVQIDDHLRIDRLPVVVGQRHVEPAGAESHQFMLSFFATASKAACTERGRWTMIAPLAVASSSANPLPAGAGSVSSRAPLRRFPSASRR
jgi:hypothetical protein